MSNLYGTPPASDEIEMTLLGPGYGECVIVHVGAGVWFVVDSCLTPDKKPAAIDYLDALAVQASAVKLLVASHWHDDHVRGLSRLVQQYSNANLFISDVFNDEESLAFLGAFAGLDGLRLGKGTRELLQSVQHVGKRTKFAAQRNILFSATVGGHPVQVMALSPTDAAKIESKLRFASFLPVAKSPVNAAPELDENIESVAIHVRVSSECLLLGADLTDKKKLGWTAVAADAVCLGQGAAEVYKVAHHGSITAEHHVIWGQLTKQPITAVSPFSNGGVNLPMDADKDRLRAKSKRAFVSSGATRKPAMDREIEKRLNDICTDVTVANPGFGAVRFRKQIGAGSWRSELFGSAQTL